MSIQANLVFRIANAVHREEVMFALQLGAHPMEANASAWNAYFDVLHIARRPAPAHYQATKAIIITGKGPR